MISMDPIPSNARGTPSQEGRGWKVPLHIAAQTELENERCLSAPPISKAELLHGDHDFFLGGTNWRSREYGWKANPDQERVPIRSDTGFDTQNFLPSHKKAFHLADTLHNDFKNPIVAPSSSASSNEGLHLEGVPHDPDFASTFEGSSSPWRRAFEAKCNELQQALQEVEWARHKADILIQEKVTVASQMKDVFREHVLVTKQRLRGEMDRLREAAASHAKEEVAARKRLTRARIFAHVQAREL
eukprot:CAMPEP_0113715676 /NCGR_PEP_ID=MMETSP0038_2-20120614/33415_1 /TAXON_ID=2898 /ORGANISM="Cryptomonas paramecium" /LENGTH=243 /DNA_ID=CAMNT_0000643011 /DNA_START=151 /DNA_END=878 /DNA_ORIENTATION=- /assembly_acc=CAM_ASM_000170